MSFIGISKQDLNIDGTIWKNKDRQKRDNIVSVLLKGHRAQMVEHFTRNAVTVLF